ncbi:hypothetical protein [Paenibacillus sp. J2TS4]|nr:hypothetical protein [Paenibacillus sp. J2TS4]
MNRQTVGRADDQGSFTWQLQAKKGVNRVIVEAEHHQRRTRQEIISVLD